jgi:putative hemolysin
LAAKLDGETVDLRPLLRPLVRVPRQTPLTRLLKRMLTERRHMVLVADGRGQTVGLLSLEDLVEELTGEIESDTDVPRSTLSGISVLTG